MPRKRVERRKGSIDTGNHRPRNGFDGRGYGIRFYPSAEQAQSFDDYFARAGCDLATLFDAVGNKFKFSLTVAADNSCYFATLTDKDEDSTTYGCWLTLQAGDPDKAVARVLWALFEVADGNLAVLDELAEKMSDRWQ